MASANGCANPKSSKTEIKRNKINKIKDTLRASKHPLCKHKLFDLILLTVHNTIEAVHNGLLLHGVLYTNRISCIIGR